MTESKIACRLFQAFSKAPTTASRITAHTATKRSFSHVHAAARASITTEKTALTLLTALFQAVKTRSRINPHTIRNWSFSHVHAVFSAPVTISKFALTRLMYHVKASKTAVLIVSHTLANVSDISVHLSPIQVNTGDRTFSHNHVAAAANASHAGLIMVSHAVWIAHDNASQYNMIGVITAVTRTVVNH